MTKSTQNPPPRKFELLSDDEDYQITLAAMSDPDNPPLTDADFESMEKHAALVAPLSKPGHGQAKKQTEL
jgi:hypothetical protein